MMTVMNELVIAAGVPPAMLIDPQHGDPVEPSRVTDQHPLAFNNDRIIGDVPHDTMSRTRP